MDVSFVWEGYRNPQLENEIVLAMRKLLTRLPASDLDRARNWYLQKLGLRPTEERPGGLRYVIGDCEFSLFTSAGASDGSFTQMGFEVADLAATVTELKRRGVIFEEYDGGLLRTENAIARIEGNYPSKGSGELAAWFRDSEGNMIGMSQPF